jgi:hypothetical protein
MQRSTSVAGIRPVTLANIAVPESLSVRSTAAAVTWLVTLSFWATNAARDEVTTSSAMRMNDSATAASWITSAFRDRRCGRTAPTVGSGPRMLMHPVSGGGPGCLSRSRHLPPSGD